MMISDAATAVFTVDAGGVKKTVSIYALGLEMDGMARRTRARGLHELADRLATSTSGGSIATDAYVPDRYRGILLEGQPGAPDARPGRGPTSRRPTSSRTPTRTRSRSRRGS